MLKRFTTESGGIISFDLIEFEKELKKNPNEIINEMKKEQQERFEKKFPKAKLLK